MCFAIHLKKDRVSARFKVREKERNRVCVIERRREYLV